MTGFSCQPADDRPPRPERRRRARERGRRRRRLPARRSPAPPV